jgi:hypothetical protein
MVKTSNCFPRIAHGYSLNSSSRIGQYIKTQTIPSIFCCSHFSTPNTQCATTSISLCPFENLDIFSPTAIFGALYSRLILPGMNNSIIVTAKHQASHPSASTKNEISITMPGEMCILRQCVNAAKREGQHRRMRNYMRDSED